MGQPFPQDATAGGQLVIPSIYSPNFVSNVSGWTINYDGSAQFNNLNIRGSFSGTDFILNSSGMFFYTGTPANGNLLMSFTNSAGVDAYGNSYSEGISLLGPGTGTLIEVRPDKNAMLFYQ